MAQIIQVDTLTRLFLARFKTVLNIRAQTTPLIPISAWPTHTLSSIVLREAARIVMMTSDGVTIPRVEKMPPVTPFFLKPT